MPRLLAVLLVYLLLLTALSVLAYVVGASFVQQVAALVTSVRQLLSPEGQQHMQPLLDALQTIGISKEQVIGLCGLFLTQMQGVLSGAPPLVGGIFTWIIFSITLATVGVYCILDGSRSRFFSFRC